MGQARVGHNRAALVRTEQRGATPRALSSDFSGYRDLRAIEQRVSLAYAAVELALRIAPEKPNAKGTPDELTGGIATFIGTLPEELRKKIIELDLTGEEKAALDKSADSVRNVIRVVTG